MVLRDMVLRDMVSGHGGDGMGLNLGILEISSNLHGSKILSQLWHWLFYMFLLFVVSSLSGRR